MSNPAAPTRTPTALHREAQQQLRRVQRTTREVAAFLYRQTQQLPPPTTQNGI